MSGGILSGGILERGDIGTGGYCPGGFCPGGILSGMPSVGKVAIWKYFHIGSNLISRHGGSHFVEGHRSMSLY